MKHFMTSQKCPYNVTFDLDCDLEHIVDAGSSADHRVQVWWRSSHVSGRRSDLRKVYRQTDGRRTPRDCISSFQWNELITNGFISARHIYACFIDIRQTAPLCFSTEYASIEYFALSAPSMVCAAARLSEESTDLHLAIVKAEKSGQKVRQERSINNEETGAKTSNQQVPGASVNNAAGKAKSVSE